MKVESITQSVCDLAIKFGEGVDGSDATMVITRPYLII